jgi:hypothetical protein
MAEAGGGPQALAMAWEVTPQPQLSLVSSQSMVARKSGKFQWASFQVATIIA